MDFVLATFGFFVGILALAFAESVAGAMNQFGMVAQRVLPRSRFNTLRPGSRESVENCLWFVRLWAACMTMLGLIQLLGA